jgi:LppP/LprE lipoprotein
MNWQIIGAIGAVALVAGIAGAVGWSLASDDDDDGDDGQSLVEATPTDSESEDDQESDLPEAEFVTAVEVSEEQQEAAAARIEEYGGDYLPLGYVAVVDNDGRTVLAVLGQDFEVQAAATQRIFYFIDGDYEGTDWEEPVVSVASIRALENGQIEVTYNVYESGDERCCPSDGTFVWFAGFDGTVENPEDPPRGIFTN